MYQTNKMKAATDVISVLANNPQSVVLIAPPESRRVAAFQHALKQINWPLAKVISYQAIVSEPDLLQRAVTEDAIVRVESMGESCETDRLLLTLGQPVASQPLSNKDIAALQLEKGQIIPSKQWYSGLTVFFDLLKQALGNVARHRCTLDFSEALLLFDKRKTAATWQAAGLAVPSFLTETISSFEQLLGLLKQYQFNQVFIKLAHGSAASGAIALRFNSSHVQAITTIEQVSHHQQYALYNSNRLITYRCWKDVERLINTLLQQHALQIECWIPKAQFHGQVFDLRVVVIANKAAHILMRSGRQVITNLHLGHNTRGDVSALKAYMGSRWSSITTLAEQAMQSFPNSLYAGVDVLLSQTFNHAYLLEANAFGDFHPNVYYRGLDTYQAQLAALLTDGNKMTYD